VRHGKIELGILADLITGMRRVPLEAMQASLPTLTGIRAEYLKGVTADRLAVLDVSHILADHRQVVQEEVEA
jgi:purine-binding chemotaxis protein CheW